MFTRLAMMRWDVMTASRSQSCLRRGEVSSQELVAAAAARAARVNPELNAIAHAAFEQPVREASNAGAFAGVPLFIKDTEDVAGMPTGYGSAAMQPQIARKHSAVTQQILAQGFAVVGKARLPEFGFSPSTEYQDEAPTRNPWNPTHSAGGSSGGPAALVAPAWCRSRMAMMAGDPFASQPRATDWWA